MGLITISKFSATLEQPVAGTVAITVKVVLTAVFPVLTVTKEAIELLGLVELIPIEAPAGAQLY